MKRRNIQSRQRGAAAVLAMLFLVLMTTLSVAMFSLETRNTQTAYNLTDVNSAQAAAEAGVRWMAYRFEHTVARPKTLKGLIDGATADALWTGTTGIQQAIVNDLKTMTATSEQSSTTTSTSVTTSPISIESNGATFQVTVAQKPSDHTILTVTSTGLYNGASRSVSMDFQIEKKIKFAIVGRVPIQLGRNTIVEGNVAMVTDSFAKGPPILMLSDFTHEDTTLTNQVTAFGTFLANNHNGYDNRVSVNNPTEFAAATAAGYKDVNGDSYIDEYDLFLAHFDTDKDGAVSQSEFTNSSTGQLYDKNLFSAIDSINGPMYSGDTPRVGYQDNKIDNSDGYAKVRGSIMLAVTTDEWNTVLGNSGRNMTQFPYNTIGQYLQGMVAPTDPGEVPVQFGAPSADLVDLNPANFQQAAANYQAESGTFAGSTSTGHGAQVAINNKVLSASDNQVMQITSAGSTGFAVGDYVLLSDFNAANTGLPSNKKAVGTNITPAAVIEESPKGSKTFQAVYKRPVFKNMHFKNVSIPQGLNALFQNCTFDGVTFVNTQSNIVNSSGQTTTDDPNAGMAWAQATSASNFTAVNTGGTFTTDSTGKPTAYRVNGMSSSVTITAWDSSGNAILPAAAGSFAYGGTKTSLGATQGNNLRFDGCTFDGPLTGNYATDYTHFSNSWEFTGSTMFNNQVDQTATIVSPQVNIEMGSFGTPTNSPSTLTGVVVVGNIDIRGTSTVDGSIIVTGDGAGNTTLAYFGADDSQTNPGADPNGGYGKLNIRYNPTRALPDGINIPIDITPTISSYTEVAAQSLQ